MSLRIWMVAKMLNIPSRVLLEYAREAGLAMRSASSRIEPIAAEALVRFAGYGDLTIVKHGGEWHGLEIALDPANNIGRFCTLRPGEGHGRCLVLEGVGWGVAGDEGYVSYTPAARRERLYLLATETGEKVVRPLSTLGNLC